MLVRTVSSPPPADLDDHVADIVDEEGVVAGEAGHRVGADAAVERVDARRAEQDVAVRIDAGDGEA